MNIQQPSIDLGYFVVGEIPAPLQYTYRDADNIVMSLAGYTAKFELTEVDGSATEYPATVSNAVGGIVEYTWTGVEFPGPGHYQGRFWAGNNVQRYASILITFRVAVGPGTYPVI